MSSARVEDFYEGKSILLTGATGYLGVVLLESLLRCFPKIRSIYILLREKKGVLPENRKEEILKKQIFNTLKEKQLDVFDKVHVIPGDVTLPRLGMSQTDALKLIEEVTVVFHVAACIHFTKPLRFMLSSNTRALDYVLDFCRELKKLDVMVYTSTAYSNCNRQMIEEEIYRLPFPAQRFLDELNNEKENDGLNYLLSQCHPKWPNHYTFSKCLSENVILDKAADLPIAIIRPSVIVSYWKGIHPGFVEEGSGMVDLGIAVGKGFVRVIHADPETNIDIIPVDVVAHTHIVAAWSVASGRSIHPLVVNCTSGDIAQCNLNRYISTLFSVSERYLLPKSYQRQSITIQKNVLMYCIFSFMEHYAPAFVIDSILSISGRKPRLLHLYRYYEKALSALSHFLFLEWSFQTQNFKNLEKQLNPEEREKLYLDLHGFDITVIADALPTGAPFYQWEMDRKRIGERKRIVQLRYLLTSSIQAIILVLILFVIYLIISPLLQTIKV